MVRIRRGHVQRDGAQETAQGMDGERGGYIRSNGQTQVARGMGREWSGYGCIHRKATQARLCDDGRRCHLYRGTKAQASQRMERGRRGDDERNGRYHCCRRLLLPQARRHQPIPATGRN